MPKPPNPITPKFGGNRVLPKVPSGPRPTGGSGDPTATDLGLGAEVPSRIRRTNKKLFALGQLLAEQTRRTWETDIQVVNRGRSITYQWVRAGLDPLDVAEMERNLHDPTFDIATAAQAGASRATTNRNRGLPVDPSDLKYLYQPHT